MRRGAVMRADDEMVVEDTSDLAAARRMVRSFAAPALSAERVDDLALVASELVSNALEHGTGAPVDVRIRSAPSRIELTVASPSFGHPEPEPRLAAVDAIRGRGLFIVAELSDDVQIDDRSETVSITSLFALS